MTRPTQEDVARRAGVSRALVSLVMRGATNVSDGSRARVLKAAEELGYRANAYARSLASKQVRTLGVLIYDVTNPYFGQVYASIATAAENAGYDVLVAPSERSARREAAMVNTLLEHRVAGLVLLSPAMKQHTIAALCAAWPTVTVGRELAIRGIDVVSSDERQAAQLAIERLVRDGHRRIAHISGGSSRPARDRAAAYRATMREYGLEPLELPGDFTVRGGEPGAEAIVAMDPRPTAVFAANDLIAVSAIGALARHGLRIPDDISVIGYDDSNLARLEVVQLTSVRQPVADFGTVAIELLTERIAGQARGTVVRRLPTELIERRTVAPPPADRA